MKGLILFYVMFFSIITFSQQDSLHLVFTITGDNTEYPIFDCGALGDINNDGFDDFVIRRSNLKYCEIYHGSENPNFSEPIKLYDQPNFRSVGVLHPIGDINGDNFDDYAQSGFYNNNSFSTGTVYVYFGSSVFDTIPDWLIMSNCIDGLLGASVSGGDINGDGINELLIGEPYNWCDGIGRAYLFYGGDSLSDLPDLTFQSDTLEDCFGGNVCANGDINGDGYNDIIISAPDLHGVPNYNGKVYIYFGDSIFSSQQNL
jgi:hypothetical protein